MRTVKAVIFLGLVCFLISTLGCGSSEVDKAKEFMAAGMYPQAIELLNKRVQAKPDDGDAHFNLGVCFLNTGNYRGADERFASAVKLKPDYGFQIGGEFKKGADEALNQNDFNKASQLYQQAVKYQPDLKETIAETCYEKGMSNLNSGETSQADAFFVISRHVSNEYNQKIDVATRDYAINLIEEAKQKPVDKRKPLVNEASKYLSKPEIDGMFPPPEWKVVGEYKFEGQGNDIRVKTVKFGADYYQGDSLILEGINFMTFTDDGWVKPNDNQVVVDTSTHGQGHQLIRAPKGEIVTVLVKRLQQNY